MRFSVWPSPSQEVTEVLEVASHADRTGWDGVYVSDHFMGDGGGFGPQDAPVLEATALIAALATATDRVRLGSLVFGTTYRHPAVLANWASTVDHLSGGRLILGIGAGWQENEHVQYGLGLPPAGARVDRFAETCAVTRSLLDNPVTDFDGRWFTLSGAVCEPKPVQQPLPLLVGAKGDRMIGLAARYADEWNMWGLPDALVARMAVLEAACERIGRDPADIARSTQALVMLTSDDRAGREFVEAVTPRAALAGTAEQIAEAASRYAEVGVDELIVPDFVLGRGNRRLDALDALAEQFAPLR
jgi:alkanesulfonate monooxygenase SsuD/methylene tetrahydromethanopterin reductase-like flavin-dependent oxidoreductase (luciferase family)